MLPADVLKIKCKFVSEVIAYLNRRKYSVSTCIECKYTYYADALKLLYGTTTETIGDEVDYECLTHAQECSLTTKANKYPELTTGCEETIPCASQASITLLVEDQSCTSTAETINQSCNCKYPTIALNNNSKYIDASIDVKYLFAGECATSKVPTYYTVNGGCDSGSCSDDYRGIYSFGFNSDGNAYITSASFITQMKVFKTDTSGNGANALTLNLNPGTSPYTSDNVNCSGCAAVDPAELVFGHANFTSAFLTLMDNVALSLGSYSHEMRAWWTGDKLRVRCTAVHNPTSGYFGLMLSGSNIIISNPSTPTTLSVNAFGDDDVYPYHRPIKFYEETPVLASPDADFSCADITAIVGDQVTYPRFNTLNSSFKQIALSVNIGLLPIEVTSGTTETCQRDILTADITLADNIEIDSMEWTDPGNAQISTSETAIATDDGTYTFELTLTNGCILTETITI
jgi:hypothetical protein